MDKVKYLPHPCSYSDKREWNKKGYRVLDVKFAPPELEPEKPKKRTRKAKPKSAD